MGFNMETTSYIIGALITFAALCWLVYMRSTTYKELAISVWLMAIISTFWPVTVIAGCFYCAFQLKFWNKKLPWKG